VEAILVLNSSWLDEVALRTAVLRIPEVLSGLQAMQKVIERGENEDIRRLDLLTLMTADEFPSRSVLWPILKSVVQYSLFQRILKRRTNLKYVGIRRNEPMRSLLHDSEGLVPWLNRSLAQILNSGAAVIPLFTNEAPAGWDLFAYPLKTEETQEFSEMPELLRSLKEKQGIYRFVALGPLDHRWAFELGPEVDFDFEVLDIFELDPMLGWFWSSMRGQAAHA
jgi:hypothetical protein